MLLKLEKSATQSDVEVLLKRLTQMGIVAQPVMQEGRFTIAVIREGGEKRGVDSFLQLPKVDAIGEFPHGFKLVAKEFRKEMSRVAIGSTEIGAGNFAIMAGPCSVESREQMMACAEELSHQGVRLLRGGAFKPRSSPYSFQGLGEEGFAILREAADAFDLSVVSEVMDGDQIELALEYCDMLQIGARNMQNFSLLKKVGRTNKPVLLKRGMSATYQDLLMSAEYIVERGNENVILCERGIRTFESYSRNTLDLAAAPILHELSHLPVIIDPSHGVGIRKMVPPLAYGALACGADGLMVEIHPDPDKALSDKEQTISFETFRAMMDKLKEAAPIFAQRIV